jgi:Amt family ammonium transporter
MNSGDTTWVLISAALVMLMTPALGFFYGGMVRKKNILSTIMFSFAMLALISIQWVLFGYSLAFGHTVKGIIGNFCWLGLKDMPLINTDYAPTIPHMAFMAFQMMFAIITPALITGAFVERIKFSSFLIFSFLWATLVYDPVAHWVWGVGGWLRNLGALDFAGGTVVHITAGFAALVFAMVIKERKGFTAVNMEPNNIPFTIIGAALLWFGWFGFNGGSALGANSLAVNAFITTNTSASCALSLKALRAKLSEVRCIILVFSLLSLTGLTFMNACVKYPSGCLSQIRKSYWSSGLGCFTKTALESFCPRLGRPVLLMPMSIVRKPSPCFMK